MLHPSYTELIDVANKNVAEGEEEIVTSRYSIILAAAKRARQLVDGADTEVAASKDKKPLSVAVEELANDQIHIMRYDETAEEEIEEVCEECEAEMDEEADAEAEAEAEVEMEAAAEAEEVTEE